MLSLLIHLRKAWGDIAKNSINEPIQFRHQVKQKNTFLKSMINEFGREMKVIYIFFILTGNLTKSQHTLEFGEQAGKEGRLRGWGRKPTFKSLGIQSFFKP